MVSNVLLGNSGKEFEAMVSSVNFEIVKVYVTKNYDIISGFFSPLNLEIKLWTIIPSMNYLCLSTNSFNMPDTKPNEQYFTWSQDLISLRKEKMHYQFETF